MSTIDFKKVPIIVLQDITLKASNNSNIQKVFFKENGFCTKQIGDKNHNLKSVYQKNDIYERKDTTMSIFEEVPYFSDSDEEKAYAEKIFETFTIENASARVLEDRTKNVDAQVQCDLILNDDDIKNFVKIYANVNIESVNEDHRELIHLCKKLYHKQVNETPPLSKVQSNDSLSSKMTPEITVAPNIEANSNTPTEFLPSRQGSVYMKEQSFSESFSLGRADLQISKIIDNLHVDNTSNEKENTVIMRSKRRLKQIRPNRFSGVIVKKSKTNHKKNVNHFKNASKRSDTLKNIIVKTKPKKQDIENIILNFQKNLKKTKKKKLNTVSKPLLCNSTKYANQERHIHKKIVLPKPQVRSLARNWMKPEKNLLNNCKVLVTPLDRKFTSLPAMPKIRHLYSPNDWMNSKNFTTLLEPNFNHSNS